MLGFVGSAKDEALPSGFPLLVPPESSLFYLSSPRPNFEVPGPGQDPNLRAPPPAQALGLLNSSHLGSSLPFPSKL